MDAYLTVTKIPKIITIMTITKIIIINNSIILTSTDSQKFSSTILT